MGNRPLRRDGHAVRLEARNLKLRLDRPPSCHWRFWCTCGTEGTWRARLPEAERDSWAHLTPDDDAPPAA